MVFHCFLLFPKVCQTYPHKFQCCVAMFAGALHVFPRFFLDVVVVVVVVKVVVVAAALAVVAVMVFVHACL